MKFRKISPGDWSPSRRLWIVPVLLLAFVVLFQVLYNSIKTRTFTDFNNELMMFARTSSRGITYAFEDFKSDLTFLSTIDHIQSFSPPGKKLLEDYYENNKNQIAAVTRMDEHGIILYTWPENEQATGQNIAHQIHVRELLETRKPVISDVFMAQQGYPAIAIHIPVFNGDKFTGSLAALIPIDYLGKKYLENLKLRGSERAWLLSENNIEIYCPIHGHTGKPFIKNSRFNASAKELLDKINNSANGTGQSYHLEKLPDHQSQPPERHLVFYRVPLTNTYWTLLISYDEKDVYEELTWFRNRLIIAFIVVFVVLAYYLFSIARVRNVLKEQKKRKEAEGKILIAERRFRALIENAPDAVVIIDENGKFVYTSPNSLKHFGYSHEEVIGRSGDDFTHPDDLPKIMEIFGKLIANPETRQTISYRFRRKTGEYRWIETTFTNLLNDEAINGYVLNFRDITERKQAETLLRQSESKFRTVFDQSPIGIELYRDNGLQIDANTASLNMFGIPEKTEIQNFNLFDGISLDENKKEKIRKGQITRYQATFDFDRVKKLGQYTTSKSGTAVFDYIINPMQSSDGKIIGYLLMVQDITERKRIESELISAKEKAEESDRLKSAFLANMSHEIRTPMNGILGFADLLKDPDINGDEKDRFINIIEKSGQRMLNIINDLIDISKIESGQMEVSISETNIREQAEYLCTFFKPELEKKGLKFICRLSDEIHKDFRTDREKVYAVITNLLKNAIKYTPAGSIEFGYDLQSSDGNRILHFYVKDTGIGIPAQRISAIFDRFVQADIEDKQAMEGAGLGLAISKAYAEMLGGTITVESVEGQGSTFHFYTPDHSGASKEENRVEKPTGKIAGKHNLDLKILIVEDDEPSRLHLTLLLRDMAGELMRTDAGDKAVEICRRHPDIDLVMMDIRLPGMEGYTATRKIREFNKDVIIIAQTAYALSGDREKALEAGCNDYISKPIAKKELYALIHKLIPNGNSRNNE